VEYWAGIIEKYEKALKGLQGLADSTPPV
jgi:hypothetical protein